MKTTFKSFIAVVIVAMTMTGCTKPPLPPPPPPPPPAPVIPPTLTILGQSRLTKTTVEVKIKVKANDTKFSEVGICYDITKNPTLPSDKVTTTLRNGTTTIFLSGLTPNTKYYYRVYGVDDKGTVHYSDSTKMAWTYGLMDIDGNGYHTVKIGNYEFTVENLRTTHYRNGDPIPVITRSSYWTKSNKETEGARCYYDNDSTKYDSVYGALYNFYAVRDPRGLAPAGWHVPSYQEYENLGIYLGGLVVNNVGGKMKEAGTKHWKAPNKGATNSTGFTGLPAGDRSDGTDGTLGQFRALGYRGSFWTSTPEPAAPGSATSMTLYYEYDLIGIGAADPYVYGFSVRLMKN